MIGRAWLVRGAAAIAAVVAIGCGNKTEIVLRVSRAASAPTNIPRVKVYAAVGTDKLMDGTQAKVFVDTTDAQADVDVSTRDLATSPFVYALQPGAGVGNAPLTVAALGFRFDSTGAPAAVAFATLDHTVQFSDGQVLEYDLPLAAVTTSAVTVNERGCVDLTVAGQAIHIAAPTDWDCDGDPHGTDCNDLDPAINHSATEICGNNVDEDCSGAINDDTDADHDGVTACNGDCIDNPAAQLPGGLTAAMVHPGATEIVNNQIDENCNGKCEADATIDSDNDHYTTTGILTQPSVAGRCRKNDNLIDCNDSDKNINPGETENPTNGLDDDCNGTCDVDNDGDTYTPSGYVEPPTMGHCAKEPNGLADCNDDDPNIHPGAAEVCDGIDENCDGKCDDDVDNDGYSVCGTVPTNGSQCVVQSTPCMPGQQCDCAPMSSAAHPVPMGGQPVPERCDGVDENCDGVLYPAMNSCFGPGTTAGTCFVGSRTCDDTNATMPWGDCVVDMNQPVLPTMCTAYDACFADPTVTDPYQCALGKGGGGGVTGQQCMENTSGGTACQPATFQLPLLVNNSVCAAATWTIVGGTSQGPWTVGLQTAGGSGANATGCPATFVVTGFDPTKIMTSTGPTKILIVERLGTESGAMILALGPGGMACLTEDNLTCH